MSGEDMFEKQRLVAAEVNIQLSFDELWSKR